MSTDTIEDRVGEVAKATGETVDQVRTRLGKRGIKALPRRMSPTVPHLLKSLPVDAGFDADAGLAFVELENGRRFYGHPSRPNHVKQHGAIADLLPDFLTADTFLTAIDVVHRYCADETVPLDLLPTNGDAIVEVGAFLGHKAQWMMDQTEGRSPLVALEIEPTNFEIMQRNFACNNADNAVALWKGAWNERSTLRLMGKGRQRNSIVTIDGGRLDDDMGIDVPMDRLDRVLPPVLNGTPIGFMYVSVNGAEIEALEGLAGIASEVRSIRVATPYSRDGARISARVQQQLLDYGFELDDRTTKGRAIGVRP